MTILPIQVTSEGVLIPLDYLHNAQEFEFELIDGNVLIRPKQSDKPLPDVHERFPWVGIAETSDPTASERVEEILAAEIDRRSGWTHKPPLDDDAL